MNKKIVEISEESLMWIDERYNRLREENKKLKQELQQKENIIKEVREYLNKNEMEPVYLDCKLYETKIFKDVLEILDKGKE